jgi:hypothetical protein
MGCAGLLATGCASARPTAGPATGQAQRKIAAGYMAIARPANRRLETDLEGIEHRDRNHLAAAKADLRDAAATEHLFDRQLRAMRLPPATEAVARLLVASNETRAKLTSKASASTSLRQLHRCERRLEEANQPVEQAVRTIRRQLGLPPPATS